MALTDKTIAELSAGLHNGDFSSVELTESYLDSIEKKDGIIGAYLTVCADMAIESVKKADELLREGRAFPLAGIPFAVKDNICTKGIQTSCGSKMLENFVPPYESTVTQKLIAQGAVVLGKTNMDEFAMGSSCENSAFKITRNPVNTNYVPGGSSGGSTAAMAAKECAFSLGSDTGGSIRQPAAFCGVVGMKPTYGRVSRYGLVAFASSLDQIGPITGNVKDNALVLNAIAGFDPKDSTSADFTVENSESYDFASDIGKDIKGLKIGLIDELMSDKIDPEISTAVNLAAQKLESAGAEIVKLSMHEIKHALPAYYIISSAEASSNLGRFDGLRYGFRSGSAADIDELYRLSRTEAFGSEVKRRIMLGTYCLSSGYYDAYYRKASQVRTLVINSFDEAFTKCDVILSPAAPTTAFKLGENTSSPLKMYAGDLCTVPMNLAGLPNLSLPCAVAKNGLPIGMLLTGRAFSEKLLYRVGAFYEKL